MVEDREQPMDFACRGRMKILQNSPHLESLSFKAVICLTYQATVSLYIYILVDEKLCWILCTVGNVPVYIP